MKKLKNVCREFAVRLRSKLKKANADTSESIGNKESACPIMDKIMSNIGKVGKRKNEQEFSAYKTIRFYPDIFIPAFILGLMIGFYIIYR